MPTSLSTEPAYVYDRALVWWLFSITILVAIMVVIGGVTRLTGSGLSMVEWHPLMGILPPLTEAEWMQSLRSIKLHLNFSKSTSIWI